MCYNVMISTDCPLDLAKFNQMHVYFTQQIVEDDRVNLKYPKAYHLAIGHPNGCSCGFRIFDSEDLDGEFQHPADMPSEIFDNEDVLNTHFLFQVIKNIVNAGYRVDSYITWYGDEHLPPEKSITIHVNDIVKDDFSLWNHTYSNYVK